MNKGKPNFRTEQKQWHLELYICNRHPWMFRLSIYWIQTDFALLPPLTKACLTKLLCDTTVECMDSFGFCLFNKPPFTDIYPTESLSLLHLNMWCQYSRQISRKIHAPTNSNFIPVLNVSTSMKIHVFIIALMSIYGQ